MRAISRKYNVTYATFWKRVHEQVEGYEHRSGGKGKPKVLSEEIEGILNQKHLFLKQWDRPTASLLTRDT